MAKNPFDQYAELIAIASTEDYVPINDPEFETAFRLNKKWFRLKERWDPKFIYKAELIEELNRKEGMDVQDAYVTDQFYEGIHPSMIGKFTEIYCTAVEEFPESIVSFGNQSINKFRAYSYYELYDAFLKYLDFRVGTLYFTDANIQKLKALALAHHKTLYDCIISIEQRNSNLSDEARTMIDCYNNTFDEWLQRLEDLAFYMRGWKINSEELPLAAQLTVTAPADFDKVESNVSAAIISLKEIDIGILGDLPLMLYSEGKFLRRQETIRERIRIVEEGEAQDSCIRTSSNYLLSSAYYYKLILLNMPNYNIQQMSFIS